MKNPNLRRVLGIFALLIIMAGQAYAGTGFFDLPYYIPENESRYAAYISDNPEISLDVAVAYVNANVDKPFYSDIVTIEDPDDLLVFCSKNYMLPVDYIPDNLVSVGGSHKLRADAAEQFELMRLDAKADGLRFVVYSSYRSYSTQKYTYSSYVRNNGQASADTYSAKPGHSEHQTGLAIDILHRSGLSGFRSSRFQTTAEYEWLVENAYKYGFILRYPNGYEDITGYVYEPWHWRYVGIEAASLMREEGIITLEEFFGKYLVLRSAKSLIIN